MAQAFEESPYANRLVRRRYAPLEADKISPLESAALGGSRLFWWVSRQHNKGIPLGKGGDRSKCVILAFALLSKALLP